MGALQENICLIDILFKKFKNTRCYGLCKWNWYAIAYYLKFLRKPFCSQNIFIVNALDSQSFTDR